MADAISEFLLPLFEPFGPSKPLNILQAVPEVARALRETYEPIKQLYRVALDTDAVAPAISATLEWLKSVGGARLPTDFEEMELDCEHYLFRLE
jgi:6-phosphogluconate dehydrogenase